MKPVRFVEEALEEFLDQVRYYKDRQKGLGERLRLSVQAATTLAANHPKLLAASKVMFDNSLRA